MARLGRGFPFHGLIRKFRAPLAFVTSHTTDANKRLATIKTHTTDALKRKAFTLAHTTDAMKHKTYTVLHTTDANKRKATTVAHTTDANKRKALSVSHTTDSYISTIPLVRTDSVNGITKTGAVGNGTVINAGGLTILERGFVISTSPNPTLDNGTKFPQSGSTGAFSVNLSGLTPGTTYHAVAYAINAHGTAYGSDVPFKSTMPLDKYYIHQVFRGSLFLGVLQNITSEFGYAQNINSAGTTLPVTVGQSPDTPGLVSPMGSNDDTVLIRNGNRVKVYEVSDTYPNGKLMFQGEINRWQADYDTDEIDFDVWSDGQDLDNYIIQGAGEVLDVTQTSGASSEAIYQTSSDYNYAGQTIKTSAGVTVLSGLTIRLNTQNVAVPITVNVYSSVNGSLLGTSQQTVNNNAATDIKFVFAPTLNVTELSTYFYEVIPGLNAGTVLIYHAGSDVYANGAMYLKKFQGPGSPTSSGPLYPGTAVDNGGQRPWNNPNNSKVSDGVYATTSFWDGVGIDALQPGYLKVTNFGFSIPAGATINGIVVDVQRYGPDGGRSADLSLKMVQGGTIAGSNKAITGGGWPSPEAYQSYGGSADLWGLSWSSSDINASDFGFALQPGYTHDFADATPSVDAIRITVYYTPNPPTVWNITPTGDIGSASDLYFKTWVSGNSVEFAYSSTDPSAMLLDLLTRYTASGGSIISSGATVANTGLSVTYTFRLSTALEAIKKCLEFAPAGWYFYVDVATDTLYFKATPATPTYTLTKGRDFQLLKLIASIENVVNDVYISGGPTAGVNLFKHYSNAASVLAYGNRLKRLSDNRLTVSASADLIGNSEVNNNKDEQYQTEATILDGAKDITLFKVGDTIGFQGFQTFVDNLVLQVVRIDYSPDKVKLSLGVLPPRVNLTVEQLRRDLEAQQTLANPASPS